MSPLMLAHTLSGLEQVRGYITGTRLSCQTVLGTDMSGFLELLQTFRCIYTCNQVSADGYGKQVFSTVFG